jgi:large conductance mechanosensitive channel
VVIPWGVARRPHWTDKYGQLADRATVSQASPLEGSRMVKEFVGFLKQYGVIGLAIAVIIGGKFNDWLKTIVDGLLMPFIGLLTPSGEWREASFSLTVGSTTSKFLYGPVIGASIDFIIVAAFVFMFAKTVLKEKEVAKR